MPVSRKPKEPNIEAFINQGGSEPDLPISYENRKLLQSLKLRIPTDLLEDIDRLVANRKPSPSRHQWILEALYEKVSRDS